GHPPFSGASTMEILRRHMTEQPPRPPGIAEPLWTVIDACLRKNPGDRPSAASLARALRAVAAGLGPDATSEQRLAAADVGSLLTPDTNPVMVAGGSMSPPGAAEPTQALPGGSAPAGADPAAPTA